MDDPEQRWETLARAHIIADQRKFREYVLVPGHPSGKDRIFLGTLGYRPRDAADARELARLFADQARRKVASGEVQFSRTIPNGLLCIIVIEVRGVTLRTVWLLDDDELRLITPFSGFARGTTEG